MKKITSNILVFGILLLFVGMVYPRSEIQTGENVAVTKTNSGVVSINHRLNVLGFLVLLIGRCVNELHNLVRIDKVLAMGRVPLLRQA